MEEYVFGVDLGGTTVKLGLFTPEGALRDKWEIPTRTEEAGKNILPDIAAALRERAAALPEGSRILGVGIGVPGPVRPDGVVVKCVNLGWGVFNVEEALSQLLGGIPVRAANDANVAALGEAWQGGGKGHDNVVMVTLGTGVGGGVILGGKILPGTHGAAGEIGHMMMNPEETECCGCGKRGCLEQYCSATGIVRLTRQALAKSHSPSCLDGLAPSAKDLCDGAKAGDALALEVLEQVCTMLGRALSMISAVCDPDIYVIGGGVSKAGDILLDGIARHFDRCVFHASRDTRFALAELGNDAGIYGCAKLVL